MSLLKTIAIFLPRKFARAFSIGFEICRDYMVRREEKGGHAAKAYLLYACTNLFVSFCNGHFNTKRVECPCCGWSGFDFIPIDGGVFWVPRMVCPSCLSYDRHRAFTLFVKKQDRRLFETGGTTLHIAPETYVALLARQNDKHRYLTTDLFAERLQEGNGTPFQSDLQRLPLSDECVDTQICFHVLEHIKNDRVAVEELYRTLRSGGVAYIMVPLNQSLEKTEFFGEPNPDIYDHYWAPGRDYHTHLETFDQCVAVEPKDFLSSDEMFTYGIPNREIIYVCAKA